MFRILMILFVLTAPVLAQEEYPRVEFSGQLQADFSGGDLGAPVGATTPVENGIGVRPTDSQVYLRRVRPSLDVYFSPDLMLSTEINYETRSSDLDVLDPALLDLFLRYSLTETDSLQLGRFKIPFGWEGLRSSRNINTIARSDATVAIYQERDTGLAFEHESDGLTLQLAGFAGQGRAGERNSGKDVAGRALFQVSPALSLGASAHLGTFRRPGSPLDVPVRRFGAEVHFQEGPFTLEGEYLVSDGYNQASRDDTPARGFYVTAVGTLDESLDAVLSYDQFDPDLDAVDPLVPASATNARSRVVLGLNYYFSRDPAHRFMINYEFRTAQEGAPAHTQGVRMRYQFAW